MRCRISHLLFIATLCLFVGRTIQAGIGNPSIAELIGDEGFMSPFISWGYSWTQYSEELYPVLVDACSNALFVAWCIILLGLAIPVSRKPSLVAGAVLALLETMASLAGEYFWYFQAAARTLFALTPGILLLYQRGSEQWYTVGKWASALVFTSHGMFAMNILPVPGFYGDMLTVVLGVQEQSAAFILWMAGLLDLLAAASLIFMKKPPSGLLIWMIVWGTMTALARVVTGFEASMPWESISTSVAETFIRVAHGMVPWALYMAARNRS